MKPLNKYTITIEIQALTEEEAYLELRQIFTEEPDFRRAKQRVDDLVVESDEEINDLLEDKDDE